jgi:peptidoglycan DL-endopeptidase CwlO
MAPKQASITDLLNGGKGGDTSQPNPVSTSSDDNLTVTGVGALLNQNVGSLKVGQATKQLAQLGKLAAQGNTTAQGDLVQIQHQLYAAGYYGTKEPKYGTLSGDNSDLKAFNKMLTDAANSGQKAGDYLTTAAANGTASGKVGSAAIPQITEKQTVYAPEDIQSQVNTTAQQLLGRNATQGELQAVTDQLNAQSAQQTGADESDQEASAANQQEGKSGNADVDSFLAATRQHESGGNYQATNPNGGASGAYQYIQSTWSSEAKAAGYGQYAGAPAANAPPSVQDAVARYNALQLYSQTNSWGGVAANWYDPAHSNDPNYAPPGNGGLTIGQYSADITNLMAQGTATAQAGVSAVVGVAGGQVGKASSVDPQTHPGGVSPALNGPALPGAVVKAESQAGTPYVWGGESPGNGFDCSGLVQWSYAQTGVQLPRVAQAQYDATTKVDSSQAKAGDLVFFGTGKNGVDHVGIYIGNDQMIVAPHTGTKVQVQSGVLERSDLVGVTQVTPNGMTPADWASLSAANKTPGASTFLQAQNAQVQNGAVDMSTQPADNVTVTDQQAGASSVADAATNVLENQHPDQFQAQNLLGVFDTINKSLSASSGTTAASAGVRGTPVSLAPETS